MVVKIAIDAYQESEHAKWPSVVATITQQTVRKFIDPKNRSEVWRIESELRYTLNGEELTSNIHSRTAGSTELRAMRSWVSQHPPDTSLPVRYDPQHHDTAVPDAGDMPESGPQVLDDLKAILLFLLLSIACITIGRVLQRRREEKSMVDLANTNG
jgi:hypothetical protein